MGETAWCMHEDCIESTEGFDNEIALAEHMAEAHSDVQASTPTPAVEEAVVAAARQIRAADALLICTGAGMGVDSGLGTFRGRNAGVWPPLKAMQRDFSEMSNPSWFESDPHIAWSFWRWRHQAYTSSAPHEGYSLLAKWGARLPHGFFSVTSNIDGHWERTEGVDPSQVYECHGALTRMQPVHPTPVSNIWPTDNAAIAALQVPDWDLESGQTVQVRTPSSWSDSWPGQIEMDEWVDALVREKVPMSRI